MTTGTVNASSLNLRSAPDGDVVGSLPRGTMLTVVGRNGQWLEVEGAGRRGFVSSRFVRLEGADTPPAVPPAAALGDVHFDGDAAIGPGGVRFARRFRLGVFNSGRTTIASFLGSRASGVAATSLARIMQAVSANEGMLEAINTWDDSFLTFGIFQWTAGKEGDAGELAALLSRLKRAAPAAFTEYFGQYGLDAASVDERPGRVPVGVLSLNGKPLGTAAAKEEIRSLEWAYRFWRAGHDGDVRAAQIEHAAKRLDSFYRLPSPRLRGRDIATYITSEYGIALILDEHVNRPGHVPGTLADALDELATHADVDQPQAWADHEEQELLSIYLERRATTTMTDAAKRGETVRTAVTAGTISNRRGSFQV